MASGSDEKMVHVGLRMKPSTIETYRRFAEASGTSVSELMREQLERAAGSYRLANAVVDRAERAKRRAPLVVRAARFFATR